MELLVGHGLDGGGDLVDGRADAGGQRRQGVEVEVVELGGVAGQDLAQLGLGGVAEPGPQCLPGEGASSGPGWLTPIQQFCWKYSVASRGSTWSAP